MVKIVVGANFGDEGKGLMTNYFAEQSGPSTIIVLNNGGAQRGHTVCSLQSTHVFHHYGSSLSRMVPTYCTENFIINPIRFSDETGELLFNHCMAPLLYVNPKCMVTTPWDMMANQIIEANRSNPHGSCGLGIWETIKRNNEIPISLFDTQITKVLVQKIHAYYADRFKEKGIAPEIVARTGFNDIEIAHRFTNDFYHMGRFAVAMEDNDLKMFDNIIFENGQGLLLDQDNTEYAPHLTASKTGIGNAVKICEAQGFTDIEACYVTRSYLTRHGAGPMYSEVKVESINPHIAIHDETNVKNVFQGSLRYGFIDPDKLLEQIRRDSDPFSQVSTSIAVTHLNEYYPDWVDDIADYKSFNKHDVRKERK